MIRIESWGTSYDHYIKEPKGITLILLPYQGCGDRVDEFGTESFDVNCHMIRWKQQSEWRFGFRASGSEVVRASL